MSGSGRGRGLGSGSGSPSCCRGCGRKHQLAGAHVIVNKTHVGIFLISIFFSGDYLHAFILCAQYIYM